MKGLTERQKELLDYIVGYTETNGYPPVLREMGEALGISHAGARNKIAALIKKGYIIREDNRTRRLRVIRNN